MDQGYYFNWDWNNKCRSIKCDYNLHLVNTNIWHHYNFITLEPLNRNRGIRIVLDILQYLLSKIRTLHKLAGCGAELLITAIVIKKRIRKYYCQCHTYGQRNMRLLFSSRNSLSILQMHHCLLLPVKTKTYRENSIFIWDLQSRLGSQFREIDTET